MPTLGGVDFQQNQKFKNKQSKVKFRIEQFSTWRNTFWNSFIVAWLFLFGNFFIVTKIYPFIISRDFLNKSKKPQPQFSSVQALSE